MMLTIMHEVISDLHGCIYMAAGKVFTQQSAISINQAARAGCCSTRIAAEHHTNTAGSCPVICPQACKEIIMCRFESRLAN